MSNTLVFAFDFDGVISDSAQAYVDAINSVSVKLGASHPMTLESLASMPDYKHAHSATLTGVPLEHLSAYSDGLREYFHQQPDLTLIAAIAPLLQQLAGLGSVVVVSANEHGVIETALNTLAVKVDGIYAHHGREQKTAVLKQLQTDARVLMVGDTLNDCYAAEAAGVDMVAVSWGWQARDLLLSAGVPVVDNVEQLKRWVLAWS